MEYFSLKWILAAVVFWLIFIWLHSANAGSADGNQQMCAHTARVITNDQASGSSADGMLLHFEQFMRNTPAGARNGCYETWCAGMTREMIVGAFAEDGMTAKEDWQAAAMVRCMAWSRGEVHSN